MQYYSTRKTGGAVTFASAALQGLADDGGLFIPAEIPAYKNSVLSSLASMDFMDIAFETIAPFVHEDINDTALHDLIQGAFNFPAPVVDAGVCAVLELFHGPTAAFKDFGARFMARAFSFLRRAHSKPLTILVATSGDTGGAVASGFWGVEGISVTVLYPKGRVSPLQEKQIAGLGGNISALAVEGSFDDCQRLVKSAFASSVLKKKLDLSSANSINIARLIPQAVYYTAAAAALLKQGQRGAVFSVPSGNFGNLTAGIYAMKMGAPIGRFIAATNINKTFPEYLENGVYKPRASSPTISNAMDVGAPSNFERMEAHWTHSQLCSFLQSIYVTDDETRTVIKEVYEKHGYIFDPHGAVGCFAVQKLVDKDTPALVLETAHPAKFAETVEPLTGPVPLPSVLAEAEKRVVSSRTIPVDDKALAAELLAGSR